VQIDDQNNAAFPAAYRVAGDFRIAGAGGVLRAVAIVQRLKHVPERV
jgi:hypothetical protein